MKAEALSMRGVTREGMSMLLCCQTPVIFLAGLTLAATGVVSPVEGAFISSAGLAGGGAGILLNPEFDQAQAE